MKIILKDDIKNLGHAFDTVEVKSGYARNYLIPQGFAELATPGNLKRIDEWRGVYAKRLAKEHHGAVLQKELIEAKTLVFPMSVGDGGRLYGSVTNQNIADAFKERFGIEIDRKKFISHEHLKTLGTHELALRLHRDITAMVKVVIEDEDPQIVEEVKEETVEAEERE